MQVPTHTDNLDVTTDNFRPGGRPGDDTGDHFLTVSQDGFGSSITTGIGRVVSRW